MRKNSELGIILGIAIPSIVTSIGHLVYGIVDNIMVGRLLGAYYLASSGLATNFYHIFLPLGIGSLSVIAGKISFHLAKGDELQARNAFRESLIFSFLLGIIITATLWFSSPILKNFSNSPEVGERAVSYLRILCLSAIFTMPFFAFEKASEGLRDTKAAMFTIIICNFINVFLNYTLILGKFGMPELGMNGAAIATFITAICELIIIVLLFPFFPRLKLILKNFFQFGFNLKRIGVLFKVALPAGFHIFFESSMFALCMFIASVVSIADGVAYQVSMIITTIPFVTMYGIMGAVTVRVAHNFAIKNNEMLIKIASIASIFTVILMSLFVIVYWVFGENIIAPFLKPDEEGLAAIKILLAAIILIGIFEIFDATQMMFSAVLRGMGDTIIPSIFSFICFWCLSMPLAYFLGYYKLLGLLGVWIGFGVGMILACFLFFGRMVVIFRKNKILLTTRN